MSERNYSKGSLTRNKLIGDLGRLISFRTVTEQLEGFDEAMAFISDQISPDAVKKVIPNNGEPILLASNVDTKTPDICYLVHVDVVDGKDEQFSMKVVGDRAMGRGTSDMKFSIPVGYHLLNDLISQGSNTSFMLAVTSDEEHGGFDGAGWLADKYGLNPKLLIVPDGGNNFDLIYKSKGVCQLVVNMKGAPGHASTPWIGENALSPVVKLATRLLDKYEGSNGRSGWVTTMNLGALHGGHKLNQIPADAELGIDFRYPPEHDSPDLLLEYVRDLAADIHPKLNVRVKATGDPTYLDQNNPYIQQYLGILTNILGREIIVRGTHGSTDARHFAKHKSPFIMVKPVGGDIHGDNEFIDVASVLVFYQSLLAFVSQYK